LKAGNRRKRAKDVIETPENVTQSDPPPGIESHVPRLAANLSPANHSPGPFSIYSGQTPGILFEIRSLEPNPNFDQIVALIPWEADDPVPDYVLANAALFKESPRLLRVFRQLFATFKVPPEYHDGVYVSEVVAAVKDASELLHDLQKAGVF
jgi:hypothetical protein